VNWFNPSTAHHYLCSSNTVFTTSLKIRELPVNSPQRACRQLAVTLDANPAVRARSASASPKPRTAALFRGEIALRDDRDPVGKVSSIQSYASKLP
jgi:hypothetical protein